MFNINGIDWAIVKTSPNHHKLVRSDGSFTVGACDNDTKTIYLNENLTDNFLKKVLCHEITHAAMFSYGVNISIEQEELLADLIATYGEEIIYITNKIFRKIKNAGTDMYY